MNKCKTALATAIIISGMTAAPSFATDISISGFFNGVATIDEDGNTNFKDNTKLGVQVDANVSDKVSGTFQVVSRENAWSSSVGRETTVEYGFLAYKANDDTTVRAGRLRLPFFMLSEYLEVGAVVPWIDAPGSIYHQLPSNAYNGMDAIHTVNIGDTSVTMQGFYGESETSAEVNGMNLDVNLTNAYGGNVRVDLEDWELRVAYGTSETQFKFDKLTEIGLSETVSSLNQMGQIAIANAAAESDQQIAADLQQQGVNYLNLAGQTQFLLDEIPRQYQTSIFNAGFNGYLTDNVSVMGEFSYLKTDHAIINDDKGFYLASTYDFNNGFKLTGTYSWAESITNMETQKDTTNEFILTGAYSFANAWTIKGEAKIKEVETNLADVVIDDTQNTFAISINYIF